MTEMFIHIGHWHWWSLAIVLVVVEVFVSGFFVLWIAIAAAAVGLLVLLFPAMGWEYQILTFALLTVISVALWWLYSRKHPTRSDQPTLNRRGEQYIGRTFTLEAPITNGQGKVHVDDTNWKIIGDECDTGSKVRVVGVDGVVLKVECVR